MSEQDEQKQQFEEAVGEALEAIATVFDVAKPSQYDRLHSLFYSTIQMVRHMMELAHDVPQDPAAMI